MTQAHCNTKLRRGTPLSYEVYYDCDLSKRENARLSDRAPQTFNNEIEQGQVYQFKQQQNYKGKVYEYDSVDTNLNAHNFNMNRID